MGVVKSVLDILNRPVPLPAVLERPIYVPVFGDPIPLPRCFRRVRASDRPRPKRRPRSDADARPRQLHFLLEGELRQGTETLYRVGDHDLVLNGETWVFGEFKIGHHAKVKGVIAGGHERVCTSVVITPR